ncbi:MAG: hypothetical protein ABI678_17020, partial [Kofleriaceae bacterium]
MRDDVVEVRGELAELARDPVLAPHEQRRAEGMPPAAAAAFVAGRTLVRRLLGHWLAVDPCPIRFQDEPDAKPRLDPPNEVDFSVAHAGDLVVVALARGRRVGVDVEPVSHRRAIAAIT